MTLSPVVTDDPKLVRPDRERKLPVGSYRVYRSFFGGLALAVGAVLILYFYSIISQSIPGWRVVGWHFFTGSDWNFGNAQYGALPLIVGTLLTTSLAVLVAGPVGILAALAIVHLVPKRARLLTSTIVELLAFVPSVIYGVWGFIVIVPWFVQTVQPWLYSAFGGHWPFNTQGIGFGIMLGSLVLAVMILPTVAAISRDVLLAVPDELVEGGLSVGASKGQVLGRIVLPAAKNGLIGAVLLGTARALGETIALVLLLGNLNLQHPYPRGLNSTSGTLATEIANNFGNLTGPNAFPILCCLACTLMVIVASVNLTARLIVRRNLQRLQP